MIATPAPASETHLKEKMPAFATTTTSLFMCVVQEGTRQNNNEESQWEANRLNHKMKSTSNNTLQLKYEKQLNVKTSRATIPKRPHKLIPLNFCHCNIWELNFGQTICDKPEVGIGNILRNNLGNPMGT